MGEIMGVAGRRPQAAGPEPSPAAWDLPPATPDKRKRMTSDTVIWQQEGPIGRITLNRPESMNAWTAEFGAALRDVITGPASDPSVRAVAITGAGRGFSSGADLKAGF